MTNPTATVMIPYHALNDLLQRGTRAAQPDAADVTPGTLYCLTDAGYRVEQSDGVWFQVPVTLVVATGAIFTHNQRLAVIR